MVKKHGVPPTIFALLSNKQRTKYVSMFELLKEIEPNLEPSLIIFDFEQVARCAMRETFPDA